MTKLISREWATPVTIGLFGLMSATGLLMFFHLDSGLNKFAHQWLGWGMVAAVAAHAAVNWIAFKRYFLSSLQGRIIIGVTMVALACSFISLPGGREKQSTPALAMRAIAGAPIVSVAALAHRPVEKVMADLAKAGISLASADASLESAIGEDRQQQAKAMAVLFGKH
jgi:hypothetical protein